MEARDKALIRKVGRYYLQYRGVVDVLDLLKVLGAEREAEVDSETLEYIRQYVLYIAVRTTVEAAIEALRDRLTYRELHTDYSEEDMGEVNVDLTTLTYPSGLVSYFNFREGANAPEYGILGYIARRVYKIASKCAKEIRPDTNYFSYDLDKTMKRLKKLMKRFPEGRFREPIYTDPDWLVRAYRAYEIVNALDEIKPGMGRTKEGQRKNLLRFVLWKLYELYVFYLVVSYLESKGFEVKRTKVGYMAEKDGVSVPILFNAPLENSSLRKVDDREDLEKFMGRPDVSLKAIRPVIFECKYSTNVGYITLGRFKVMAYTYEYNPLVSVLVYPGLKEGEYYDKEDEATIDLHRQVEARGFVDFVYNSHMFYIMKIDPLGSDYENLLRLNEVLDKEVLKKVLITS
jgi:hypothetical protein